MSRYLKILEKLKLIQKNQFISDDILIGSAERYLHVAIECIIDVGNHIVAAEKLGRAQNYSEIFSILQKSRIISKELEQKLVKMSRFRNRLVHVYFSIDTEIIHGILQKDLGDFKEFVETIKNFLRKIRKEKEKSNVPSQ